MAILLYWLRHRHLVKERGWRLIQLAALFFIIWNVDAFLVHILDDRSDLFRTIDAGTWHASIQFDPNVELLAVVYYLGKMDHLWCAPGMILLYFGLRSLLHEAQRNQELPGLRAMVVLFLKTSSFETPTRLNAMSLPLLPVWIADLLGSALMCIFSLLAVQVARRLRRTDPNNVVWTYLLWLCYALAAFALSRSVGHIVRRLLLTLGYDDLWSSLQPISGAMNSLLFVVVASFTLFFERVWKIYQEILADKRALQEAHGELLYLNRNLERMVEDRTHELSASERKYRRIFETSQDMIMVTEADSLILDMNQAGARMLGVSSAAATVGKYCFKDFFSERAQWDELVAGLMRGETVTNEEIRLQALDGRSFTALISAKAEQPEPGQALAAIHFLAKDISKRQAMEKQFLHADKLSSIGQLAAGVAHEMNNPLGIILGYTQLLFAVKSRYNSALRGPQDHRKARPNLQNHCERLLNFARSTKTVGSGRHPSGDRRGDRRREAPSGTGQHSPGNGFRQPGAPADPGQGKDQTGFYEPSRQCQTGDRQTGQHPIHHAIRCRA